MTARKVGRMWSSGIGEAMSFDRRPGRPDAARRPRRWPASRCSPAALLVGAGRDGDADRARHRRRRRLAGGPAAQRGADDTCLSACRRGPGEGRGRPILQRLMVLQRRHLPRRADRAARRRAGRRRRARRLRDPAPALAAQRRRADPARCRARPGARLRHRNHRQAALGLLLREGQRRPHPRPRRLRDLHPLPADPAGALAGGAQLAPALGGARGAGLGGVPPGAACPSASATRSRSSSPPTTRPTTSATCST